MPKTVEAVVDENGRIRLLEPLPLRASQRVLVTVLEEKTEAPRASETARLSENVLARDWTREEEDEAWSHLQPDR